MSRQPNKTLIGAFVVGAVALAVAGLFIFSSGNLFKETRTFVLYFDGSLKGLDVGAPVNFKGIKIGSVTDIKVQLESEDFSDIRIPVLIEIEPDMIKESSALIKSKGYQNWRERREEMQRAGKLIKFMIERGLRAQLISQSMVTGKLMIQLDFYPDKPARFVAVDSEYPEMPTIPSRLDEIAKAIEEVPFKDLIAKATLTIDGIERLVNAPELKDTIVNLRETLQDLREMIKNLNSGVGTLTSNVESTLKKTSVALVEATDTLVLVQGELKDATPVIRYELSNSLKELADAARSLNALTEYLQRHPESLLRGKGGN
jgi:paraquat-inducible protein B